MSRIKMWGLAIVAGWLMSAGVGWSADAPATGAVLGKLHHANQKEISMGKLAQKNGRSRPVKDYGRTLVKDHVAADKKVAALAKQESIDLAANTPAMDDADMASLPVDADFDAKFAKAMLDDHEQAINELSSARDGTRDAKLRVLIDELLPTLRSHRDMAKRLVESASTRASL